MTEFGGEKIGPPPGPEDPIELSKRRILLMAQDSPHDFSDFKIEELQPEDFAIEQRYQTGVDARGLLEELTARMQDFDFFGKKRLLKSQKQLGAYLINQLAGRLR